MYIDKELVEDVKRELKQAHITVNIYSDTTLIASFYGMNLPVYGEELPHAFALIVLLSIFFSGLAFCIFRKIKWF